MTEYFIHCIGSQKRGDGQPIFNMTITEKGKETLVSHYPISLKNAIELHRELTDFLAHNNIPPSH